MIRLGQVTLSLERREVYQDLQPVPLSSRAFDILEVLVHAKGRLVSKDEFLSRVWPDTVVEENNLQVHISALRKLLGKHRELIRTVPGRGYRLVGEPEPVPVAVPAPVRVNAGCASIMAMPIAYPSGALVPPHCAPLSSDSLVYIVDDERSVRTALVRLLRASGIACKAFDSAQALLEEPMPDCPVCLLLDVNLSISSGFELQQILAAREVPMPIIFMTGYGTIPLSVKAIKAGAHEFLTKPFDEGQLLSAIEHALDAARADCTERSQTRGLRERFNSLTPREREVLALLVEGRMNKQIAHELGTREVTTKVHKKHVMTKMRARSLVELVKMCEVLGQLSPLPAHHFN